MNQNQVFVWILALLLAAALTGPLLAQVSIHFHLSWHFLSAGAGTRSPATVQIDDVLGQRAAGQSAAGGYRLDPGFGEWAAPPTPTI